MCVTFADITQQTDIYKYTYIYFYVVTATNSVREKYMNVYID